MSYKKDRRVKVYEAYVPGKREGYYGITPYKSVPQIKLTGQWLADLGFDTGTQMHIEYSGGRLVITKADEVVV